MTTIAKSSKQNIVKNKNRKYFKAAKDINSILNFPKDTRNLTHDYADQAHPKHRYTAFECNVDNESKSQERSNESTNSGKISSFSVSYYHK
jgi:hypothetical protein